MLNRISRIVLAYYDTLQSFMFEFKYHWLHLFRHDTSVITVNDKLKIRRKYLVCQGSLTKLLLMCGCNYVQVQLQPECKQLDGRMFLHKNWTLDGSPPDVLVKHSPNVANQTGGLTNRKAICISYFVCLKWPHTLCSIGHCVFAQCPMFMSSGSERIPG